MFLLYLVYDIFPVVCYAKMAEPIRMLFGVGTYGGKEPCISWGHHPAKGIGNVGEYGLMLLLIIIRPHRYIQQDDAAFYRITSIFCYYCIEIIVGIPYLVL